MSPQQKDPRNKRILEEKLNDKTIGELFTINCLWVGTRLRPLEQVCLLSMLKQGHRVRLFGYKKIENVPQGIEFEDAREILPEKSFLVHSKRNSASLGSNIFRYNLMKENHGLWLDMDIILIRPIQKENSIVFGYEDTSFINGAVLFIPKDNILLDDLIKFVSDVYPIPPFLSIKKRIALIIRKIIGVPKNVQDMEWGVFGPSAITYFSKKNKIECLARDPEVFYPVSDNEAHKLFSADWDVEQLIKPTTQTVHLWNDKLRRPSEIRPDNPIGKLIVEKNSFVERYARSELGFQLESE
jgi:hypothetical protein